MIAAFHMNLCAQNSRCLGPPRQNPPSIHEHRGLSSALQVHVPFSATGQVCAGVRVEHTWLSGHLRRQCKDSFRKHQLVMSPFKTACSDPMQVFPPSSAPISPAQTCVQNLILPPWPKRPSRCQSVSSPASRELLQQLRLVLGLVPSALWPANRSRPSLLFPWLPPVLRSSCEPTVWAAAVCAEIPALTASRAVVIIQRPSFMAARS